MSVHVLYLSYDGMTDPLGQSQVIPYLDGLSRRGYKLTLVSFEKKERYALHRDKISGLLQQADIAWYPLSYTKSPPVLSTLYDLARLYAHAYRLHKQKKFSIVHCRSYICSLAGLMLKRRCGTAFLFDMRGFYADERVDGKIWNLRNPLYRLIYHFFKRAEKTFFQEADYIISLTHAGKRVIETRYSLNGKLAPVQVIPCCSDLQHFSPATVNKALAEKLRREVGNGFVLGYVGSMGTWYMPDEMMDFFKELLTYRPDATFMILTPDAAAPIRSLAAGKGIDPGRLFIREVTRDEMPTYMSLFDLAVFFIKPVFSKTASSPTKHGELMSMSVPVVANEGVGDVADIIRKTQSGVVISEFSATAYRQAIEEALNRTFAKNEICRNAARVYGLEQGIDHYDHVYREILQKSPVP